MNNRLDTFAVGMHAVIQIQRPVSSNASKERVETEARYLAMGHGVLSVAVKFPKVESTCVKHLNTHALPLT